MEEKIFTLGDYFLPDMLFPVILGPFIPSFRENIDCAVTDVSVQTYSDNIMVVTEKKRPVLKKT